MKLFPATFPAKCHERATLRKLWRQTENSSLLPGQQFTVDRCCTWWLESQLSNFAFVLFWYITNHLMTGPLGNSEFCFPRISMFPETKRFSGNKIHCSQRDQSLSVYCYSRHCLLSPAPSTVDEIFSSTRIPLLQDFLNTVEPPWSVVTTSRKWRSQLL